MADTQPPIPPIPPDAKRAAPHPAPPADLTKPAPEPTPSIPVPDDNPMNGTGNPEIQAHYEDELKRLQVIQHMLHQEEDAAKPLVAEPQPMEAMFYQMRDDQKKLERAILYATVGVLGASLLLFYIYKKNGRVIPETFE